MIACAWEQMLRLRRHNDTMYDGYVQTTDAVIYIYIYSKYNCDNLILRNFFQLDCKCVPLCAARGVGRCGRDGCVTEIK